MIEAVPFIRIGLYFDITPQNFFDFFSIYLDNLNKPKVNISVGQLRCLSMWQWWAGASVRMDRLGVKSYW